MIVLIGGVKGGTGKSTLATNIAAHLAQRATVLLLDVDPQASSYNWVKRRYERYPNAPPIHSAQAFVNVYETVRELARHYQHIVIDAGGHNSNIARSAMLAAQSLYLPLRPAQADLETLPALREALEAIRPHNPRLTARVLLSLASTNPMIRETHEARSQLIRANGLMLSTVTVRDRKVYRDAFQEGVGVTEMTSNKAIPEIQLLVRELFDA